MKLGTRCSRCGNVVRTDRVGVAPPYCPRCMASLPAEGVAARDAARPLHSDVPGYVPATSSTAPPPEVAQAASAQRYGNFVRVTKLGSGGMGDVWKAWDTALGRWVALKFLRQDDPEELARFVREAETAAQLSHPNIAAIHEVGEQDGRHYLAMQYVEGPTLEKFPRRDRKLLVRLIRDAARAVDFAHQKGIVHRDLKPSNLMVARPSRGDFHLYVLDFGLARRVQGEERITAPGIVVGSPAYMPPEQARGDAVDRRSDVYALGATLYELLTGRAPFAGTNVYEVLKKVVEEEPGAPRRRDPTVDADLEVIVLKCLEKDPERRYRTAAELADDLDRFLEGEPIAARPAGAGYRLKKRLAKRKLAIAAGLAAAALVAAILVPRWVKARVEVARQEELRGARERAQPYLDSARQRLARLEVFLSQADAAKADIERLFREARGDLAAALERSPGHEEAYLELGRLHLAIIQRAPAREYFAKAIASVPRLAPARLERALIDLEDYEDARHAAAGGPAPETPGTAKLRAGIDADLAEVRSWSNEVDELAFAEALFLFAEAKYNEAAAGLGKYLARVGTSWKAREWRGHALYHAGALEEAIRELETARRRRPGSAMAWMFLGMVHEELASRHEMRGRAPEAAAAREDALRMHDGAVRLAPQKPGAHVNRGIVRHNMGDVDGSLRDYDEALRLDPQDVEALNNRGLARHTKGDLDGALKDYDDALRLRPRMALGYLNRGVARRAKGEPEGALRDFDEAIRLQPMLAGAFSGRGAVRAERGDFPGALGDHDEAVRLSPENSTLYFNRGVAREAAGDPEGALQDHEEAIRRNPRFVGAYVHRADLRRAKGDREAALRDYDEAIRLDPKDAVAHASRGKARLAEGDLDAALRDFDEAIRLDAGRAEVYTNRGVTRAKKGDLEGALRDHEEAIRLSPGLAAAYLNRGYVWMARGDLDRALRDYEEAVRLAPRQAEAYTNRGGVRRAKGDHEGAMRDFDEAVRLDPRCTMAFFNRAVARAAKEDLDGALRDYDEAIRLDPRLVFAYTNRGLVRSRLGDPVGAILDYDAAILLDPRETLAYLNRALTRAGRGDREGAVRDFEKALEFAPPAWPHRAFAESELRKLKSSR